MEKTLSRWEIKRQDYYFPVLEIKSAVTYYSPRRPTAVEWALMALVERFGQDPQFFNWPVDRLFSEFLSVPDAEKLVQPVLEQLVWQHRVLSCSKSLQPWEGILLGDLAFTPEGRSIYQRGSLPSDDQEKPIEHLYDVTMGRLLEAGDRKTLTASLPETAIPVVPFGEWEDSYPLAHVRSDLEKNRWKYAWYKDQTEIRSIIKASCAVLWKKATGVFQMDATGRIDVQFLQADYAAAFEKAVAADTETHVPFLVGQTPDLRPERKWGDIRFLTKNMALYEEIDVAKQLQTYLQHGGSQPSVHFIREEWSAQIENLRAVKGLVVVLRKQADRLNLRQEKGLAVINMPAETMDSHLLYLNSDRGNVMASIFPLDIALSGDTCQAVITYTTDDRMEKEWQDGLRNVTACLMLEADRDFSQEQWKQGLEKYIILACWMSAEEVWKQAVNRIRQTSLSPKQQLALLRGAKDKLTENTGKSLSHWQDDLLDIMEVALPQESQPVHALQDWLDACPLPILRNDAEAAARTLNMLAPKLLPQNEQELAEMLKSLASLPIHQPTIQQWSYPALYPEHLLREWIHNYMGLEESEKQEPYNRLERSLQMVLDQAAWFMKHLGINSLADLVGIAHFKEAFTSMRLRDVIAKFQEWEGAYEQLEETLGESGAGIVQEIRTAPIGGFYDVLARYKAWLAPFCTSLPEGTGRVYVLDESIFLDHPGILAEIPDRETVLIASTVTSALYDRLYEAVDEEKQDERVLKAIEAVEQARQRHDSHVRFIEPDISLLQDPQHPCAHAVAVAMQHLLYMPRLVSGKPAEQVKIDQGHNTLPTLNVEVFLQELKAGLSKQNRKSGKEKKKGKKK